MKAHTRFLVWLTTLGRTRFGPRRPKPPCAFKLPMINVFCNSHCFSQLAAFFIGARAERSTTENCLWFLFRGLYLVIKHVMYKITKVRAVSTTLRSGWPRGYLLAQTAATQVTELAFKPGPVRSEERSGSLPAAGVRRHPWARSVGTLPVTNKCTIFPSA